MSTNLYIGLLSYTAEQMRRFKAALPDALKVHYPRLVEKDPVAMTIIKEVNRAITYEMGRVKEGSTDPCVNTLQVIRYDVENLLSCLDQAIVYCCISGPIYYGSTVEEYRAYILSIAEKVEEKIKKCMDPIIHQQLVDAEKEYGQPMAIALPSYPPPTYSEETKKFLRALLPDTREAAALKLA